MTISCNKYSSNCSISEKVLDFLDVHGEIVDLVFEFVILSLETNNLLRELVVDFFDLFGQLSELSLVLSFVVFDSID